jgi:hypothetical protein
MRKFVERAAVATVMSLASWAFVGPSVAAPPTVVPSPGYDARLAESHAALSRSVYVRPVHRARGHRHRTR